MIYSVTILVFDYWFPSFFPLSFPVFQQTSTGSFRNISSSSLAVFGPAAEKALSLVSKITMETNFYYIAAI
jgi:hypothetical protein